ncbi:hypothetical protein [Muricoccus radiodurans]|uniref:hypothetical protein n=1 Tax=Muricoccus radiodurans TaxID=2231721 RepID=UPI003CEA538E
MEFGRQNLATYVFGAPLGENEVGSFTAMSALERSYLGSGSGTVRNNRPPPTDAGPLYGLGDLHNVNVSAKRGIAIIGTRGDLANDFTRCGKVNFITKSQGFAVTAAYAGNAAQSAARFAGISIVGTANLILKRKPKHLRALYAYAGDRARTLTVIQVFGIPNPSTFSRDDLLATFTGHFLPLDDILVDLHRAGLLNTDTIFYKVKRWRESHSGGEPWTVNM